MRIVFWIIIGILAVSPNGNTSDAGIHPAIITAFQADRHAPIAPIVIIHRSESKIKRGDQTDNSLEWFRYLRMNDCAAFEKIRDPGEVPTDSNSTDNVETAYVQNSHYTFKISKGANGFKLDEHVENPLHRFKGFEQSISGTIDSKVRIHGLPSGLRLPELLDSNKYSIKSSDLRGPNDDREYTFAFSKIDRKNSKFQPLEGVTTFRESQGWACTSCDFRREEGGVMSQYHVESSYSLHGSRFVISSRTIRGQSEKNSSNVLDWKNNYTHSTPPNNSSRFYLTHYGLPEPPGFVPPSSPTPRYVWLLLAAATLAGVAFGCRAVLRRQARKKTIQPLPPRRVSVRMLPARSRTALTLVELLVVIGIIGILLAILLPAVQRVRGSAAKLDCQNHIKQLALALHAKHDSERRLPPGHRSYAQRDRLRYSGWTLDVLPYLEQSAVYDQARQDYRRQDHPFAPPHQHLSTPLAALQCPSDPRVRTAQYSRLTYTLAAFTSYLGVSGLNYRSKDGVLFQDSLVRFADVTDGLSNTLLLGERPPSANFQFGWWYAGVGQRGDGSSEMIAGVREHNRLPVLSGSRCGPGAWPFIAADGFEDPCGMFHFWSPHSGGANFALADGSVRFLRYSANGLLPALASRSGGEVEALPD